MPRDIRYTETGGFELNEYNDLDDVRGNEQVKQHIGYILQREGVNEAGAPLTATGIAELKSDVRITLRSDDYTDPPYNIFVDDVDPDTETVTLTIETQSRRLDGVTV